MLVTRTGSHPAANAREGFNNLRNCFAIRIPHFVSVEKGGLILLIIVLFILPISPQPVSSGAYIISGTNFLLYDPNKYSSKRGKVIPIPTEH